MFSPKKEPECGHPSVVLFGEIKHFTVRCGVCGKELCSYNDKDDTWINNLCKTISKYLEGTIKKKT